METSGDYHIGGMQYSIELAGGPLAGLTGIDAGVDLDDCQLLAGEEFLDDGMDLLVLPPLPVFGLRIGPDPSYDWPARATGSDNAEVRARWPRAVSRQDHIEERRYRGVNM